LWAGCVLASAAPKPGIARFPLRFEENCGQSPQVVRYTAHAGAYDLQLTDRGPAFLMDGKRVQLGMVHSSKAPRIEGLERLAVDTNYLVGQQNRWHTGVANYARVRYHEVYPGVDIVYYGNSGQLEYDFQLQPGANPDAIRMEFAGADHLAITPDGDLSIGADGKDLIQKKPVIFQDGRRIAGRYTLLARNQAGLALEKYDSSRPLVIDPILQFAQYFGSSGTDQITAMKMGPNNLLYIAGSTNTSEMPYIDGAFDNSNAGLTDCFIAIMDTSPNAGNQLIYFSYLGGSNIDIPLALDVDQNGVVYLTGSTTSTNFPMAGNSFQTTGAGSVQAAFVAAIDHTQYGGNSLIYSSYLGGTTGLNVGNGIAVDRNGQMYVVGTTRSTDFPVTDSAYAGVLYGPQDAFITVLSLYGSSAVYSTYMGGELADDGRAIAVGSNGLVYFAASTFSTLFPMEGNSYRNYLSGAIDVVVGVIDITKHGNGADGTPASMIYSSYLGGNDIDEVRSMSLDANNNMLLTGYTFSSDFPVTANAVQPSAPGNGDVFLTIVNPNDPPHFMVYSSYFGGSQGEVAYAIKSDTIGGFYVSGYTLSTDLYTVAAPQPGSGGGINMFMAQINPNVAGKAGIKFSSYLGAKGIYVGNAITLGSDGSVYMAGYGQSGLPTWNSYAGGSSDGFLVVLK
jgi:hypothetical protein